MTLGKDSFADGDPAAAVTDRCIMGGGRMVPSPR